jgi:hypothetical protein
MHLPESGKFSWKFLFQTIFVYYTYKNENENENNWFFVLRKYALKSNKDYNFKC